MARDGTENAPPTLEWTMEDFNKGPENSEEPKISLQPIVEEGMTAQRDNDGKLMLDALPIEWLWALAAVMNAGAEHGYPYRNWEEGGRFSTPVGCALRHFGRWMMLETYDKDGTHHLAKAAWNLLQLMTWEIRDLGEDDLNRQPRSVVSRVTSPEKQYE